MTCNATQPFGLRLAVAWLVLLLSFAAGSARAQGNPGTIPSDTIPGVLIEGYQIGKSYDRIMTLVPGQTPNVAFTRPDINFWHPWHEGFGGLGNYFILHASGFIRVPVTGTYRFKLLSDDGSRLHIDGQPVVDHDGLHYVSPKEGAVELSAGTHSFRVEYFQDWGWKALTLEWIPPGATAWAWVPPTVFSHQNAVLVTSPGLKRVIESTDIPGNGLPLSGVHPSYDLQTVRRPGFEPRVGGMDFLPDGRLVISTWLENKVYLVSGVQGSGPFVEKEIAAGLNDPLGLKVVDGQIYVLERKRLLRLVDLNGDEVIDRFDTVSTGWGSLNSFHEFDNGLAYRDGYFYITLTVAIDFGGSSSDGQHPDRGKALQIDPRTGAFRFVAAGLRSPNGVGTGVDGQVFITDNQGDWLPANKLIHLQEGAFYGHRDVDFAGTAGLPVTPPALWLPHNLIANSPSQPAPLADGPYRGQMIFGDVTYGGVTRAFLEKVDGQYQGAAFRFTQGLEAGINRLVWGPDSALYVGGVGAVGNWGQPGKLGYGLQRLRYNGRSTFELLAVRARTDGLELEFTQPLPTGPADAVTSYALKQWTYEPTTAYGGAPVNQVALSPGAVRVSADRRRVFLAVQGLKTGYVVHLQVAPNVRNAVGEVLWNAEAWYTLNRVPTQTLGLALLNPEPINAAISVTAHLQPNPVVDRTALVLENPAAGAYEVQVLDNMGREVSSIRLATDGTHTEVLPLDLSNRQSGIYLVRTRHLGSGRTETCRLLKE